MSAAQALFIAHVAVSGYNAGVLWAMQLMHYPLYAAIGNAEFQAYLEDNNRRAILPAILPAVAAIFIAGLLIWKRPAAIPLGAVVAALLLTLGVMVSSLVWQAGIHAEMAHSGKSLPLIRTLVMTNWVRVALDTAQLGLAVWMLSRMLR